MAEFVLAMAKSSAKESTHLSECKPVAAHIASPMSPKFRTLYVIVVLSFTGPARRRILFRCSQSGEGFTTLFDKGIASYVASLDE
jgi:hypothetical protein